MEVELHVDQAALRRHRRGLRLALLAFALYLPAVFVAGALAPYLLGREAADRHAGGIPLVGQLALMATVLWINRESFAYHCPRCGRRLPRATAPGQPEGTIHCACGDCRVVWDLGWAPAGGGGVGG